MKVLAHLEDLGTAMDGVGPARNLPGIFGPEAAIVAKAASQRPTAVEPSAEVSAAVSGSELSSPELSEPAFFLKYVMTVLGEPLGEGSGVEAA
jgi:hypothetical protein